jgi:hypothetical protein
LRPFANLGRIVRELEERSDEGVDAESGNLIMHGLLYSQHSCGIAWQLAAQSRQDPTQGLLGPAQGLIHKVDLWG